MMNACGKLFLLGAGLFAAVETIPSPGPLEYTVQFSALGVLGWAVWYMLTRVFPRQLKDQQREREAMRQEFKDALDTILEVVRAGNDSD